MSGGRQVRVLVADSDQRVRSALRLLLEQEPGLVIGECSDRDSLLAQITMFKPDLLLLDWELGGRPATALPLPDYRPKTIVLSGRPESEQATLAAGADAFVSKGDPPDYLLSTLRSVVQNIRKEN